MLKKKLLLVRVSAQRTRDSDTSYTVLIARNIWTVKLLTGFL